MSLCKGPLPPNSFLLTLCDYTQRSFLVGNIPQKQLWNVGPKILHTLCLPGKNTNWKKAEEKRHNTVVSWKSGEFLNIKARHQMNGWPLWNISTPAYYMFATSGPTLQFDPEALASSSGVLNKIQSPKKQCKPFRGEIFHQCSRTYFNALPKKMKSWYFPWTISKWEIRFHAICGKWEKLPFLLLCTQASKQASLSIICISKIHQQHLCGTGFLHTFYVLGTPLTQKTLWKQDRLCSELTWIPVDGSWSNITQHTPRMNSKS